MARSTLLFVLAFLVAGVSAQCVTPGSLRTVPHLQGQSYLLAPGQPGVLQGPPAPPYPNIGPPGTGPHRGFATFFDLGVSGSVNVTRIDLDLSDDGVQNWGPAPGLFGPPGLVGQTTSVSVWIAPRVTPSVWGGPTGLALQVPNAPGSPWTLGASGTLTVQDGATPSPAVLATPLALAPGSYAVAVEVAPVAPPVAAVPWWTLPFPLHPTANLLARVPNTALTAGDEFLTVGNQAIANNAFISVITTIGGQPLANVLDIHYVPAATSAFSAPTGAGCYDRPPAFYEQFGASIGGPAVFDLANTGIRLLPVGSSYLVLPTSGPIVPPTSLPVTDRVNGWPIAAGTNNVDDVVTLPQPLGFTFPYPGGSTTQIVIGSNGFVHLDPAQTIAWSYPGYFAFSTLTGPPRLAPFFGDLNPGTGGSVHMETGSAGEVLVTWWNVDEWRFPGMPNTIQLAMYPSGMVEYRYGACQVLYSPVFVGWTPGGNGPVPAARDLSAAMPFQAGDGVMPPALSMSARPVLGTTPNLQVTALDPAATLSVLLLSFGPSAGIPLPALGIAAPGCTAWIAVPAVTVGVQVQTTPGAVHALPFPIPANLALVGYQLFGQSVALVPGINTAGVMVSNGLCIHAGL